MIALRVLVTVLGVALGVFVPVHLRHPRRARLRAGRDRPRRLARGASARRSRCRSGGTSPTSGSAGRGRSQSVRVGGGGGGRPAPLVAADGRSSAWSSPVLGLRVAPGSRWPMPSRSMRSVAARRLRADPAVDQPRVRAEHHPRRAALRADRVRARRSCCSRRPPDHGADDASAARRRAGRPRGARGAAHAPTRGDAHLAVRVVRRRAPTRAEAPRSCCSRSPCSTSGSSRGSRSSSLRLLELGAGAGGSGRARPRCRPGWRSPR